MNSVSEKIDERILRLLGLEDVFDLDYDTYMTLLKEAIVTGSNKLPQEELALLANERKRIRGKTGRFKPKKDKITAEKVATTKFLKPAKKYGALSTLVSKKDTSVSQDTLGIGKPLESIAKTLAALLSFRKKTAEGERRDKESQKRTKQEEGLEGFKKGISAVSGAAKKMLAPFQSIIDRIWRFIFFTLLGRAFTQLMNWLGDPKNKKKIEVLGRFLKDWWPSLAFAAGLFLTPFGKFVRTTIGLIRGFIPQLIKFTTNPAFLAIAAATAGGIAGASLESNLKKLDEITLKEKIKEAKDKGKPLSKQEIEKIKLEQLQKRVQDIQGTNIPGNALLASGGGVVPRFSMGGINPPQKYLNASLDTGYEGIDGKTGQRVSGFGPDTQAIIAQPGEIVMNKKTVDAMGPGYFLGLNRTYGGLGANKPKMGKLYNTGGMVGKQGPNISESDYNTLLAISALEDDNAQGRADVAQSLYNRLYAATKYKSNFSQTSNTLKGLITASGQYQPTFSNSLDWSKIVDKKTAAIAIMNSDKGKRYKWDLNRAMQELNATESALKNPTLQANSQKHVGGRAYFLGTSQQDNMGPGDVIRGKKSNFFSPWYLEGTQYDKERRNTAAPIPSSLLPAPKPNTKTKSKPTSKGFWSNLVGIMPSSLPFKGGGLIKEGTGMNIPGATADRQLAALQPGEFVIPKDSVDRLGISFFEKLVSMTDSNSNAYLQKGKIRRPQITPLRRGQNAMITLPPITQSASGGGGGAFAAGSKVPTFSAVSPSGGAERSMNASIYGIVG